MELKNHELHGYNKKPIFDSHVHHLNPAPVDTSVALLNGMADHFNYARMTLCAIPMYDPIANVKSLYLKEHLTPISYVAAGINHHYDERDDADFFLNEIKKYHAMGCDGIKMLEGKMELHRKIRPSRLDDKAFDKFYAYAEENAIPIVMHLGDPAENWDLSKMSEYAIAKGWYNGPEDPTLEDLRSEVDGILRKFPKLKLTLAHFYFMGDDLTRAAKMFDTYENLCFDLTPGGEMYVSFTSNYENARLFFEKYADRLVYGTDTYNFPLDGATPERRYGSRINLVRSYLEAAEDYTYMKDTVRPFHFGEEITDKIYRKNFLRIYGETPRALDYERIVAECELIAKERTLDELSAQNLATVSKYFKNLI